MIASASRHVGEMTLRKLSAAEPIAPEHRAHIDSCADCQRRLNDFTQEQAAFEAQIPFERFEAGIERAARVARDIPPAPAPWPWKRLLAVAATLLIAVSGSIVSQMRAADSEAFNRLKGGTQVSFVIGGVATSMQRHTNANVEQPESLSAGERIRIGVRVRQSSYVLVQSIDEAGDITDIYDSGKLGVQVAPGNEPTFLPESLEFTGSGYEHMVIVVSEAPIKTEALHKALFSAFAAAEGNLLRLERVSINGEQFHRTFLKP